MTNSERPEPNFYTIEEVIVGRWEIVVRTTNVSWALDVANKTIDWKHRSALQSVRIVAHYEGNWSSRTIYAYQPQEAPRGKP